LEGVTATIINNKLLYFVHHFVTYLIHALVKKSVSHSYVFLGMAKMYYHIIGSLIWMRMRHNQHHNIIILVQSN